MQNTAAVEAEESGGQYAQASEAMLKLIAGATQSDGPSSAFQGAMVLVNQIAEPELFRLRDALAHGGEPVRIAVGEMSVELAGDVRAAVEAIVMAVVAGHPVACSTRFGPRRTVS